MTRISRHLFRKVSVGLASQQAVTGQTSMRTTSACSSILHHGPPVPQHHVCVCVQFLQRRTAEVFVEARLDAGLRVWHPTPPHPTCPFPTAGSSPVWPSTAALDAATAWPDGVGEPAAACALLLRL